MKLWVIMGNDFPNGVCDSAHAAETAIKSLKEADKARRIKELGERTAGYHTDIYYRAIEFILNEVKA